jgi:hypothetical protein
VCGLSAPGYSNILAQPESSAHVRMTGTGRAIDYSSENTDTMDYCSSSVVAPAARAGAVRYISIGAAAHVRSSPTATRCPCCRPVPPWPFWNEVLLAWVVQRETRRPWAARGAARRVRTAEKRRVHRVPHLPGSLARIAKPSVHLRLSDPARLSEGPPLSRGGVRRGEVLWKPEPGRHGRHCGACTAAV